MTSPLALSTAWDFVALDYAQVTAPFFAEYAKIALESLKLSAGSRVLDIAAGPGTLALGTSSRIHVPWTRGPGERGHDALGGCAEPRTVPLKGNWTDSRGKKNGVGQGSGDCGVCVGRSVTTLQGDG